MVGFCGIKGVLLWPATTKNPMPDGWQRMPGCDLPSVTDGGCLGYLGDFTVAIQPLDRIPCPMAHSACLAMTYPVC